MTNELRANKLTFAIGPLANSLHCGLAVASMPTGAHRRLLRALLQLKFELLQTDDVSQASIDPRIAGWTAGEISPVAGQRNALRQQISKVCLGPLGHSKNSTGAPAPTHLVTRQDSPRLAS